jgi:pimeloyl-ACP methyl ester carboxylesterase
VRSREIIHANGVALTAETFGDRSAPAILVVTGATTGAWEYELCERLASGGRFVIRYDGRATWRSTDDEYGSARETEVDLALDAIGVVDALGVEDVHLVGVSDGRAIAQRVAREDPGRVASLTLVSTPATEELRAVR